MKGSVDILRDNLHMFAVLLNCLTFLFSQSRNQSNPFVSRDYFNEHLEGIDSELSWLQDQLSTGELNIDNSALLGVGVNTLTQVSYRIDAS